MIACQDKWHPSALAKLHIHLRLAAGRAYREVGGLQRSMDGGFSAVDATVESEPAQTLWGQQSVEFYLKATQTTLPERAN